jgi:integrating conjugative element protein (TIGR03746 family)
MSYTNELANRERMIRIQWVIMGGLMFLTAAAMAGWKTTDRSQTLHIPPDISAGATLRRGEITPSAVYAFSYYVWQQVNRWPADGTKDYGEQIFKWAPYLTDACREQLTDDMNRKNNIGELTQRTRMLFEVPGSAYDDSRVEVVARNRVWHVKLDSEITEQQRGIAIKSVPIRYTLRTVAFRGDLDKNPFGLALDCFDPNRPPARIDTRPKATPSAQTAVADGLPRLTQ